MTIIPNLLLHGPMEEITRIAVRDFVLRQPMHDGRLYLRSIVLSRRSSLAANQVEENIASYICRFASQHIN